MRKILFFLAICLFPALGHTQLVRQDMGGTFDSRYINVKNDWGCFELNANSDVVMKQTPIRGNGFEVNADGDIVMSPIFFDYDTNWNLFLIPE